MMRMYEEEEEADGKRRRSMGEAKDVDGGGGEG